jgi:hypothetical protein
MNELRFEVASNRPVQGLKKKKEKKRECSWNEQR